MQGALFAPARTIDPGSPQARSVCRRSGLFVTMPAVLRRALLVLACSASKHCHMETRRTDRGGKYANRAVARADAFPGHPQTHHQMALGCDPVPAGAGSTVPLAPEPWHELRAERAAEVRIHALREPRSTAGPFAPVSTMGALECQQSAMRRAGAIRGPCAGNEVGYSTRVNPEIESSHQ